MSSALRTRWFVLSLLAVTGLLAAAQVVEYKSGIIWPEPPVVHPGSDEEAPSDAVVLFDGGDLGEWEGGDQWMVADGVATAAQSGITSKQKFGDCQVHLEFATPEKVTGQGQGRGNSGLYLMGAATKYRSSTRMRTRPISMASAERFTNSNRRW